MATIPNEKKESMPACDRFDPEVTTVLVSAKGVAQLTRFPQIHPGHVAWALLTSEHGFFDKLLKERFAGLRAATVAESLIDILEIHADSNDLDSGDFPEEGLPAAELWAEESLDFLSRANVLASESGADHITLLAVTAALFEQADTFTLEAFRDSGVSKADLDVILTMLEEQRNMPVISKAVEFAKEGQVQFDMFGSVTQSALWTLGRIAAAQPERNLRDSDMLFALVGHEDSLLAEGLHVLGVSVSTVQRYLVGMTGAINAGKGSVTLSTGRMSRLLKGVFDEAAKMAARENVQIISESHLVRAHMHKIASATGNVYERFHIDTSRLKNYLERFRADRDTSASKKEERIIEDIEGYLLSRVINQELAVKRVVPALQRMRSGLSEPGQLMGVFLFLGATGVGKTELARAIADVAFGPKPGVRDPYLIRVDCGYFTEPRDIVQLVGAPQGLVGYKEGQLTNALRDKPRSVILFDEAEKADPKVWQSLLPFFDEGIVREADGTEYDATGCVLVATSNLGYKDAMQKFDLWNASSEHQEATRQKMEEFIWSRVQDYFSPEFRGRFGRENIIFFNHFDLTSYRLILRLQIERMTREMEDRGIEIVVPEAVINFLGELAWESREEGARPVRRLVTKHLRDQIISARIENANRSRFSFQVFEGSGQVVLEN